MAVMERPGQRVSKISHSDRVARYYAPAGHERLRWQTVAPGRDNGASWPGIESQAGVGIVERQWRSRDCPPARCGLMTELGRWPGGWLINEASAQGRASRA